MKSLGLGCRPQASSRNWGRDSMQKRQVGVPSGVSPTWGETYTNYLNIYPWTWYPYWGYLVWCSWLSTRTECCKFWTCYYMSWLVHNKSIRDHLPLKKIYQSPSYPSAWVASGGLHSTSHYQRCGAVWPFYWPGRIKLTQMAYYRLK